MKLDAKLAEDAVRRAARRTCALTRWPFAMCDDFAREQLSEMWISTREKRLDFETEREFIDLLADRTLSAAMKAAVRSKNHLSFGSDPEGEERYGKQQYRGYTPPRQIDICYAAELDGAIRLLPEKQRAVMMLFFDGMSSIDISIALHIPLYVCLRRVREARRMLWWNGLIEVATQGTGVPS